MRIERIYGTECETNAVNAAADPECTRDLMASAYADCLRAGRRGVAIDYAAVNRAVLARWPRGLEYVKRLAWKLVRAAPQEGGTANV